jgi:hypothetical protein
MQYVFQPRFHIDLQNYTFFFLFLSIVGKNNAFLIVYRGYSWLIGHEIIVSELMYHLQRNEMCHSYRIEMYHPYRNEMYH